VKGRRTSAFGGDQLCFNIMALMMLTTHDAINLTHSLINTDWRSKRCRRFKN